MVLYSVVYRVCMKSMYTGHVYRANINYIHKVHELSGVRIHRKALEKVTYLHRSMATLGLGKPGHLLVLLSEVQEV